MQRVGINQYKWNNRPAVTLFTALIVRSNHKQIDVLLGLRADLSLAVRTDVKDITLKLISRKQMNVNNIACCRQAAPVSVLKRVLRHYVHVYRIISRNRNMTKPK